MGKTTFPLRTLGVILLAWLACPGMPAGVQSAEPLGKDSEPFVAQLGERGRRHGHHISATPFTTDGKTLASAGGMDKNIRFWDPKTGKEKKVIVAPDAVWSLAFSPDGKYLASGGSDKAITVWDWDKDKATKAYTIPNAHGDDVVALAFSPDGKYLASGGDDGKLFVWNVESKKPVKGFDPFPQHLNIVHTVAFNPKTGILFSGGAAGYLFAHDIDDNKHLNQVGHENHAIRAIAFSTDGKLMATGDEAEQLLLRDGSGKVLKKFDFKRKGEEPKHRICGLGFTPDNKKLISSGWEKDVRLWDVEKAELLEAIQNHSGFVYTVATSPTEFYAATGGSDQVLRIWNLKTNKDLGDSSGHREPIEGVATTKDGKFIFTGSSDGTIRKWESATGKSAGEPLRIEGATSISKLALMGDEKTLVVGLTDEFFFVDLTTGKRIGENTFKAPGADNAPNRMLRQLRVSPDGTRVAGVFDQYAVVATPEKKLGSVSSNALGNQTLRSVAFMPNGKTIVIGSFQFIHLVNAENGTPGPQQQMNGMVSQVAVNPQGTLIAASLETTSRIRFVPVGQVGSIQNPNQFEQTDSHGGRDQYLQFLDNGLVLLAVSENNVARLYEAATGELLFQSPLLHSDSINTAFLDSAHGRLITASRDTTGRVWDFQKLITMGKHEATKGKDTQTAWDSLGNKSLKGNQVWDSVLKMSNPDSTTLEVLSNVIKAKDNDALKKRVEKILGDLNAGSFAKRIKAARDLDAIFSDAEPFLEAALQRKDLPAEVRFKIEEIKEKKNKEVKKVPEGEALQQLRALLILERIKSPEAKKLLKILATDCAAADGRAAARTMLDNLEKSSS